jgi:putative transposase
MKKTESLYDRRRFSAGIISCAARSRIRVHLSWHNVEDLLFERGVVVSYEVIRSWRDQFGARLTSYDRHRCVTLPAS